jgi:hypothetical protein
MDGSGALSEPHGEPVKTALLVIATGGYHKFVQPLLASARTYFVPHTPIVFSDSDDIGCGLRPYMMIDHEPWPGPTIHRYRTFLKARGILQCFDHLQYIDADMLFVDKVGEEIFSDGITATTHPGYAGTCGTPERRRESCAFISPLCSSKYFCGGFNGGETETFLRMSEELSSNIDFDAQHNITAVWHDESHLNRYLYDHPPAKVLDPSYCYPENAGPYYTNKWKAAGLNVTPKILALTKAGK